MLRSNINIHKRTYLASLILIAVSIPLSKFMMSIGEFLLLALWLWSGFSFRIAYRFINIGGYIKGAFKLLGYIIELAYRNIIEKFSLFFNNRAAVVLWSIYLMHLAGLFYTSDFDYAIKDLRVKLPLLMFPVILSTMEKINYRELRLLLQFYVAAVFVGSLISFGFILQGEFTDIRDISPFVGSIRFGLNVSFSIFILLYFIFGDTRFKTLEKVIYTMISIWFIIFLILMESVTSLGIIIIIGMFYLINRLMKTRHIALKAGMAIAVIALPLIIFFYVREVVIHATTPSDIDFNTLETETPRGNAYWHDTVTRGVEDGRYVGLYICETELEKSWNERSAYDYHDITYGGHEIKETLIRYLTSKGLRKDADGVKALTDKDIHMIENGVANFHYVNNPGVRVRILKIIKGYEVYQKTGDPSGSSVMQRIEYSKGSLRLIGENFWTGVGTGDIENALFRTYKNMNSGLKSEFMFHAHNQYFAIFITFGVFGFLWFIFALIYPPVALRRFSDYFFLTFFLIITLSMFSDDTLETQAGATLFAFFYALLLLGKERQNAPG
jgi:hypothetical protein